MQITYSFFILLRKFFVNFQFLQFHIFSIDITIINILYYQNALYKPIAVIKYSNKVK